MTRKDYERIARAISQIRAEIQSTIDNGQDLSTGRLKVVDDITDELTLIFMEDNPRFMPNKFRAACQ